MRRLLRMSRHRETSGSRLAAATMLLPVEAFAGRPCPCEMNTRPRPPLVPCSAPLLKANNTSTLELWQIWPSSLAPPARPRGSVYVFLCRTMIPLHDKVLFYFIVQIMSRGYCIYFLTATVLLYLDIRRECGQIGVDVLDHNMSSTVADTDPLLARRWHNCIIGCSCSFWLCNWLRDS